MSASVPSAARRTRNVPGKRPVRLGRSGWRHGEGTNGNVPRTRKDPPGGAVSRTESAPSPRRSFEGEGEGAVDAVGDGEDGDAEVGALDVVGRPSRDPVHATMTSRTAAMQRRGVPRSVGRRGCIPSTLAARPAGWLGRSEGSGRTVPGHRSRKCDKTGPYGLTADHVASYGAPALIGERPGTGSRQGTLAETPRSRTSRKVGSSGTLRSGHFSLSTAPRARGPSQRHPDLSQP